MNSFEEANRLHEILSRYEHEGNYAVQYNPQLAAQDMLLVLESHSAQAKELARLREAAQLAVGVIPGDVGSSKTVEAVEKLEVALRGEGKGGDAK